MTTTDPAPGHQRARARRGTDELRALAEQGARELGPTPTADEVAAWAARTFPGTLAVACSMADAVLPAVVANARARRRRALPRHRLPLRRDLRHPRRRWPTSSTSPSSTCCRSSPSPSRTPSTGRASTSATRRPAAGCARSSRCEAALAGYEAWVTGIRRDEGPTRADTPLVTFDEQFGLVKLNPLAAWTFDEVVDHAVEHRVPVNLLLSDGYPSIGCEPCTQRVAPGDDPRAGRWAGFAKTECGLHP